MIHVEDNGENYLFRCKGSFEDLSSETACAIAGIMDNIFKEKRIPTHLKRETAGKAFDRIVITAVLYVEQKYGFNILDYVDDSYDDDDEPEEPEHKGNPFTMGMSGEALLDFLTGMKGEI